MLLITPHLPAAVPGDGHRPGALKCTRFAQKPRLSFQLLSQLRGHLPLVRPLVKADVTRLTLPGWLLEA